MKKREIRHKVYVVYRNKNRVSEIEHLNETEANKEADRWREIIKRWPDGSQITVREEESISEILPPDLGAE